MVLARCMLRIFTFALSLSTCEARKTGEYIKMKNYHPQPDSIAVPPAYLTDTLSIAQWSRYDGKHL